MINHNKLGRDAQAIAAAEQQLAHGVVIIVIIAKRECDARCRAAAPVELADNCSLVYFAVHSAVCCVVHTR